MYVRSCLCEYVNVCLREFAHVFMPCAFVRVRDRVVHMPVCPSVLLSEDWELMS